MLSSFFPGPHILMQVHMHTHTHTTHSRAHKDSRHMPAVPSPPSVMAAGARDTSSDNQQSSKLTTAPARETLASMKNKEAAFYGMDSEEFTDRGKPGVKRMREPGSTGGREAGQ